MKSNLSLPIPKGGLLLSSGYPLLTHLLNRCAKSRELNNPFVAINESIIRSC